MEGIFGQLGIDWKLILSQAFNFVILLIILRAFVYKPLMNIIKERNRKIEEGIEKANEADIRLKEVDSIAKGKLKEADLASLKIIKDTENRAKLLEQSLQKKADQKHQELMKQIEADYKKQQEESKNLVSSQAAELIKRFIIKTVELDPKAVDEALIKKAISQGKHEA